MPKISPCRRRFCSYSELHLFVDFCLEGCAVVRRRMDQPGQEHPLLAGLNRWVNWRGEKNAAVNELLLTLVSIVISH